VAKNVDDRILVRFQCEAYLFFCSAAFFALIFVKIFFVYGQRYPLEISTGTEVIDHADYEYAIFNQRELSVQNPFGIDLFCMFYPRKCDFIHVFRMKFIIGFFHYFIS